MLDSFADSVLIDFAVEAERVRLARVLRDEPQVPRACADQIGTFGKFVPPTVVNGKVYMATFSKKVIVYGPTGGATPTRTTRTRSAMITIQGSAVGNGVSRLRQCRAGTHAGPVA